MLKGKFSSRRRVTEEVDAMSGLANLSDVMLVFACGLMAAVITFLFSFLVNWVMHYRLKKIGMVESMKSVD